MKKLFIIHTIAGQTFDLNITDLMPALPIGASVNHPEIINGARTIAVNGWWDGKCTWIAPSQIGKVEVVFELTSPLKAV